MAPPKGPRPTTIDEPAATSSAKQKAGQPHAKSGKGANSNRTNNNNNNTTAQLKELKEKADRSDPKPLSNDRSMANINGIAHEDDSSWSTAPTSFLEAYRNAHLLRTPPAFHNPMATALLTCGVGRSSPTMLRPKAKRRVEKSRLASVVRSSFANSYVKEMDVLVGFAYRGRMRDRAFRQRFPVVVGGGSGKSAGINGGLGKT